MLMRHGRNYCHRTPWLVVTRCMAVAATFFVVCVAQAHATERAAASASILIPTMTQPEWRRYQLRHGGMVNGHFIPALTSLQVRTSVSEDSLARMVRAAGLTATEFNAAPDQAGTIEPGEDRSSTRCRRARMTSNMTRRRARHLGESSP
ncbi:MAG: hypothetical protein JWN72_1293 [Thermoleophilia bacterium]|nr:hypothetical protein [Thermoleophilia bacterium]